MQMCRLGSPSRGRTRHSRRVSDIPSIRAFRAGDESAIRDLYREYGRVVFATSDSRKFHVLDAATGKPVASQEAGAFMFSSPTLAGDVVLVGVLNGQLDARDASSGALLWSHEVPMSRGPAGRLLAADRTFDGPVLYASGWGPDAVAGFFRQTAVGSVFSTPIVADGLVLFGSADGALYALE